MKFFLCEIAYLNYKWYICVHLRVTAKLPGIQLGYTMYCCFPCELDNKANIPTILFRHWSQNNNLVTGLNKLRSVLKPSYRKRLKYCNN